MSPQLLARLSEFRRAQAIVTNSGLRCERWYGNLLRFFLDVQFLESEPIRRAFSQEEFDAFCADPAKQTLVEDILASI